MINKLPDMKSHAATIVKYENYYRLLNSMIPEIRALALFNSQEQRIWSSSDTANDNDKKLESYIKSHPVILDENNPVPLLWQQLDNNETIFSLCLLDEFINYPLNLVILVQSTSTWADADIKTMHEKMTAIGECIRNEQGLNQELEDMADELGMRYDELNLIYHSESRAISLDHTQDSLQRLAADCLEFLAVDMVALLLPEKKISIYNYDNSSNLSGSTSLLTCLEDVFYEKLRQVQTSVVINNQHDARQYTININNLPYKFLLSPLKTEKEDNVIGMLAIINANEKNDFSNSDRNLLDIMAKKVTKIILTNFDSLTGLENEHSFDANIKEILNSVHRTGTEHAILNINIDRLKVINDISGREAGDTVIRLIGKSISKLVRARDSVARLSGDKFGVILEGCPLDTAKNMAQRISENIEALEFEWRGQKYELSACIGVAPITVQNKSTELTLSSVEAACSAAKERGRNSIQVYEQDNIELLKRKGEMRWIGRIQSALQEDRFVLFSQLIQGLGANKDIQHYEILLRLYDEQGELVSPGDFLPAAERYKLMPDIDRWVIQHTIDQTLSATELLNQFPCQVSINLSGQSLGDDSFTDFIFQQLDRLGSNVEHICFEITESAAIENLAEARLLISRVKSRGCTFSLDDFGTGLSSFSYLQNLDVDYLKIDGSFVRKIDQDPVSEAMVSAINQVGHAMNLQTIAEYVENRAIMHKLEDIGVDFGQGYGLGKPQPLQSCLDDLIAQKNSSHSEQQNV